MAKREGRFHPSETGEVVVSSVLVESFQDIFDYEYTARMEDHLNRIETGRECWKDATERLLHPFLQRLETAEKEMRDLKSEENPPTRSAKSAAARMVIKWGKFGRFLACSAYPNARTHANSPKPDAAMTRTGPGDGGESCEKCGRAMVLKRGRFGEFMACSGYPECKNTKKIVKSQTPCR